MQGATLRRGLIALLASAGVLLAAPMARAAVLTLATDAGRPQVAVDANGTGHFVWNQQTFDNPSAEHDTLHYCQVPRGGGSCALQLTFQPPVEGADFAGPKVLLGPTPGQVILLTQRCCAMTGRGTDQPLWMYSSSDGGHTFAAPQIIGDNAPSGEAIFGPGQFSVSTITDVVTGATLFQTAPLTGFTTAHANVGDLGPGVTPAEYNGSIGLIDQTTPIIAESTIPNGGGPDQVYFRVWGGGAGDYNNLGAWKPPVSLGNGDEPHLGYGPRGVYLLEKTGTPGNNTYVVRRFDGTTFGPPTAVSQTGDPIFRDFYEDGTGGLNAAWSNGPRDLIYRYSTDGTSWSPLQTLVPHTQDDSIYHIDVGACAPGNGFAVWDQNNNRGQVHAVALGSNASCAAPINPTCPTQVSFGVVQAQAKVGCFARSGSSYLTSGPVTVNGLQLTPQGAAKITIDSTAHTLRSSGVLDVKAGALDLAHQTVNWLLPPAGGQIEIADGSGNPATLDIGALGQQVLGLKANGLVLPRLTAGATLLPLNLQVPSPVGGLVGGPLSDDVTLRADNVSVGGLNLSPGNVHIHLDDAWLGIAELKPFDISYTSDPAVLTGTVGLLLPVTGSKIDTSFTFQQGNFVDATAALTFPAPGVPLASTFFLNNVNLHAHKLTDCAHPTLIAGGVGISGGPQVAGQALLGISGGVSYAFPETSCGLPGVFRAEGTGSLIGIPAGSLFAQYKTSGQFTFGAGFGVDLDVVSFNAAIDGGVDFPTKSFYAEGTASASLIGIGTFANADAIVSNVGVGACAKVTPLSGIPIIGDLLEGSFKYHWGGGAEVDYPGCDISDFKPVAFSSRAGAHAAAASLTLKSGLPFAVISVTGASGPPAVALSGPRERIATAPGNAQVHTPAYAVAHAGNRTLIELFKPSGGTWQLAAQPGSPAISAVASADGLPDPQVTAHVRRGRGRERLIDYKLRPIPGQTVRFVEQGPATSRIVGSTSSARGRIRFNPGDGPAGPRTIVALVDQGGFPRKHLNVASYIAPAPQLPPRPKRVRVRRAAGGLSISWGRSAGAARYVVRVLLRDGRLLEFMTKAPQLRVGGVPGIESGTVMVAGVRADNRPGSVATARLKARPNRPCSKRGALPPRCRRRAR